MSVRLVILIVRYHFRKPVQLRSPRKGPVTNVVRSFSGAWRTGFGSSGPFMKTRATRTCQGHRSARIEGRGTSNGLKRSPYVYLAPARMHLCIISNIRARSLLAWTKRTMKDLAGWKGRHWSKPYYMTVMRDEKRYVLGLPG